MNKKLDQLIDEIWCAGYNKGANNLDDDNTEFINDMRAEILNCMNNQPIESQSDETRLDSELDDILCKLTTGYTRDELLKYTEDETGLDKYEIKDELFEVDKAKQQILAWHETEKQKYAMAYTDNHLITVQTIIEYEEWFNDYKEYLSKDENCSLSINNDKISSFCGIPIDGQKYHMATGRYNVRLSSPDFYGLYNYLKYKMIKSKGGKVL